MLKILYFIICCINIITALYPTNSNIVTLTGNNFEKLVIDSEEIWVVEFYAPWCTHCENLVPEFIKASNALKGVVKFGAINGDEHKYLSGKFKITGYPTIKIFGTNKKLPEDISLGRTSHQIVESCISTIKNKVKSSLGGGYIKTSPFPKEKHVIDLTDDNFDKTVLKSNDLWLVEFYAPWCGHCKNLAPHWAKAATELKGKVKLGTIDGSRYHVKASQYQIKGYPTIKVFARGTVSEYNGARTSSHIVTWALDKLNEHIPGPEIQQIIDQNNFNEACALKTLCVISFLPYILDCQAQCRNQYLKILTEQGILFRKNLWGWVWTEANAQTPLENALDVGGFGYPAMTVINIKKMKHSVLRGPFSREGIFEFLRDLSHGKGTSSTIKGTELPKIVTIEPWNGADGLSMDDLDLFQEEEKAEL